MNCLQIRHIRINGFFNSHSELREALVSELITWIFARGSLVQETIGSQLKLWYGTGLTHIHLIRGFLEIYGPLVLKIPQLRSEYNLFREQYSRFMTNDDFTNAYRKVIYGDREDVMPSRNFVELLRLARDVAALDNPMYKNYATALKASPHVISTGLIY